MIKGAAAQFPPHALHGEGNHAEHGGGVADPASKITPPPSFGRFPSPSRSDGEEQGFTLVELMVVLVIIGLLATIVIINVMPAADRAAVTKARADIATLEQGIEMYRLDNQRYPTTAEGLQVLLAGRYIRRLPDDPWRHPYRYAAPGQGGKPFTIASWGADGREGGTGNDADITN